MMKSRYVRFQGGIDGVTPYSAMNPGSVRLAVNVECKENGGFRSLQGYEKFDGQTSPSDLYTDVNRVNELDSTEDYTNVVWTKSNITVDVVGDYSTEMTALSPVAYWRLAESAGSTATDETVNSYDGTYVDSPTLGADSLNPTDSTNTAVTFNASDYMTAEYSFGTIKSIAFIVKPTTLTSESIVFSLYGGSTTVDAYIDTASSNYLTLTDGTTTVATTTAINAGTTYHIVITNDTGDLDIYVDGKVVTSSANTIFSGLTVTHVGLHCYYGA